MCHAVIYMAHAIMSWKIHVTVCILNNSSNMLTFPPGGSDFVCLPESS